MLCQRFGLYKNWFPTKLVAQNEFEHTDGAQWRAVASGGWRSGRRATAPQLEREAGNEVGSTPTVQCK